MDYGPHGLGMCRLFALVLNHPLFYFIFSPGKSALHWASAVNNVDAAMVLLKNGANKDMQNNKVKNMGHTNMALTYHTS